MPLYDARYANIDIVCIVLPIGGWGRSNFNVRRFEKRKDVATCVYTN